MKWRGHEVIAPSNHATASAVGTGDLFMSGTIPLKDAVPASGLDPGAAPDWRSVAPSRQGCPSPHHN